MLRQKTGHSAMAICVSTLLSASLLLLAINYAISTDDQTLGTTRQLSTSKLDDSYGVSADRLGNVYISGCTYGDLGGDNAGALDAFLVKISDDP